MMKEILEGTLLPATVGLALRDTASLPAFLAACRRKQGGEL